MRVGSECSLPTVNAVGDAVVARAYDGSSIVFRFLRSAHWGPELMNLGYYPAYFGLGRFINAFRSLSSAQRILAHKAISMMEIASGHDVLDIACGRGGSSYMIRHSTPARTVHAIDLLDDNINLARKLFPPHPGLTFQTGNAEELQFADNRFDRILCCEAAFHFPNRPKFLSESARVLKPGGQLVVIDFVWSSPGHRQSPENPHTRMVRDIWEWTDMATEEEYRSHAKAAGLVMTRNTDWSNRVTKSLQQQMEIITWLSQKSWGRRLLVRKFPLLASMNDQDWNELEAFSKAHRYVTDRTQYMAFKFHKPKN